jgi:hypothetical protein
MTKKSKRKKSSFSFWLKHVALSVILVFTAYFVIKGALPSKIEMSTTTNAAAKGLSQFYENFRNSATERQADRGQFVIELGKPTFPVDDALAQRALVVKPSSPSWTGDDSPRRFDSGGTLKDVLSSYAKSEGVELLWYLERDYVVKQNFRVEGNFVSALYQIGRAINDDFEFEVYTFFCPKHRAAVITQNPTHFVRTNCRRLSK